MFLCPMRCNAKFPSRIKLFQHMRKHHSISNYAELVCKHSGCQKQFRTYQSFKVHIFRYHPNGTDDAMTDVANPNMSEFDVDEDNINDPDNAKTVKEKFADELALMYLKIREKHVLPVTIVKEIMDDFVYILQLFKDICEESSGTCLAENMLDVETLWNNLKKESFFTTFCKSIGLVEPVSMPINCTASSSQCEKFQYVPILKTLKHYLSHADVLASIEKDKHHQDVNNVSLLFDYADGTHFTENAFFRGNRNLLRLILYCDELEVCNPIGSARTVNKLTCLYFTVGNVECKYLSNLQNIHLLAVIPSRLVKKYGYVNIFKPIENDIKILETTGVTVTLDSNTYHFRGGISCITGDNLGIHDMGGFRRCFSSGRICRFCMCTYEEISLKFDESQFTMRTVNQHQLHVNAVAEDRTLIAAYGIRASAPFSSVISFNPVLSYPSDIQHDFLEGILVNFFECMVESFHNDAVLTKMQFLRKFQAFKYGHNDKKSMPQHWSPFSTTCCTASEMWCLFRTLPFIVSNSIPSNNVVWKIYLKLCLIADIIFAPVVNVEWISFLEVEIKEFYELFSNHFKSNIKPKMHFLIHYPQQILKFGPLRKLWCMRFEAFHQKIKKIVKRTGNYKNVALLTSSRVQKLKCWEQHGSTCLASEPKHSVLTEVDFLSVPTYVQNYFSSLNQSMPSGCLYTCMSLNFDERFYHIDGICVLEVDVDRDEPTFFRVISIYRFLDAWFLAGEAMLNDTFSDHLHSYIVQHSNVFCVIKAGTELNYHPLDFYKVNDLLCIRLKYRIASI